MRGIGENSIWIKRVFCKHSKYADQKPANSVTNLRQKFASQRSPQRNIATVAVRIRKNPFFGPKL